MVQFLKDLTQLFISNLENRFDSETLHKIVLIHLIGIVSVGLCLVLGISRMVFGGISESIVLIMSALFLLSLVILQKQKPEKYNRNGYAMVLYLSVLVLFMVFFFEEYNPGWFAIIPFISIVILSLRSCISFNLIFLFIFNALYLIFGAKGVAYYHLVYSNGLFVASFLFMYSYEFMRITNFQKIDKAMIQAQAQYKEKNEFLSRLSHQIRTPLNNIIGLNSVMNRSNLDEVQNDYLDTIQASANNLVSVVNSIDMLSKVQPSSENVTNNTLAFSLILTINSTINLFAQTTTDIKFKSNYSSKIPDKLIGNSIKVKQVLLNVFESFVKYKSKEMLQLTINTSVERELNDQLDTLIEIRADKLLRPTMRMLDEVREISVKELLNLDKRKYIDLVDLNVSVDLLESLGGKMRITLSESYTLYEILIPLKRKHDTLVYGGNQTKVLPDIMLVGKTKQQQIELYEANVLLVEDNVINQRIVALSLQKAVKNVDVAANGKEALDMFAKTKYDIILMDVQMPIMDGIKATIKLREIELGSNSHIPIIAVTANALAGDKEECLSAGMDDYISKPFHINDLIDKMKYFLSREGLN